ncbi:MAG: acylneuraminate cytidylyltransferase family protein [Phycisphaerae bacterium]|jgi:CMP-N-acetylneuraminic acid synthetase
MKVISIITARGGSKGLPGKNIKSFGGKPLIGWTVEQAKGSSYIDDIVVSTDAREIAAVAEKFGGRVPFLRPESLAQDDTPSIDVVINLLKQLEQTEKNLPDFVVLLQPTSPLRTSADIDAAFEMLLANKSANAVVSVAEVSENPYSMKMLTNQGFINNFITHGKEYHRRQDEPAVYKLNGAIYICRTDVLLQSKIFLPEKTLGYIMPKDRSIDIDDIVDFKLAELIFMEKKAGKSL